jgi:rhodanese-related sulfurtransferase
MSRVLAAAAAVAVVCSPLPVLACDTQTQVTVAELASLRKAKAVAVLDANDKDTRARMGVIPGAILLTKFNDYALTQLPKSKTTKLVFYCASTECTASQTAAERATAAGYSDVAVLPVGIKGWAQAGMPIDHLNKS